MRSDQQEFSYGEDWTIESLVEHSLEVLRSNEPPEGYYGCFGGGKDSVLLKALCARAGVRVDWHYNVTTIDPPELVRFIRAEHPDVRWERPRHGNFLLRMEQKGFPTRRARWCCEEYKESRSPAGRVLLMGIRAEESVARARRYVSERLETTNTTHHGRRRTVVVPILRWASDELWSYLRSERVRYCSLYDEGFHRLGCIGCPMATTDERLKEFERWPRYEEKWRRAFQRIWQRRHGSKLRDGRPWFGDALYQSWEDMWEAWLRSDHSDRVDRLSLSLF